MSMTPTDFLQNKWVTGELAGPTGSGITQTTGHATVPAVTYAGSDVSTNIADCTTAGGSITIPGAWTDLIDFNIGSPIKVFIDSANDSSIWSAIVMTVDSGEDAAEAIRAQVIIDGVTVWDQTAAKSTSDVVVYLRADSSARMIPGTGAGEKNCFNCNTSFKLRATRNGTFANADTGLVVGEAYYVKYQ